jgi:hypothetical protein
MVRATKGAVITTYIQNSEATTKRVSCPSLDLGCAWTKLELKIDCIRTRKNELLYFCRQCNDQ